MHNTEKLWWSGIFLITWKPLQSTFLSSQGQQSSQPRLILFKGERVEGPAGQQWRWREREQSGEGEGRMLRGIQRLVRWQRCWAGLQPKGTSALMASVKSIKQKFTLSTTLALMPSDTDIHTQELTPTRSKPFSHSFKRWAKPFWKHKMKMQKLLSTGFYSRYSQQVCSKRSPALLNVCSSSFLGENKTPQFSWTMSPRTTVKLSASRGSFVRASAL